jgi:hypothetical protein
MPAARASKYVSVRSIIVAVGFSITFLILACDFPRPPQTITVSYRRMARPAKPADIKTLQDAVALVMTVCKEDLNLPVVDPIQVLLYKNTASFASYGQGWRTLPIDTDNIRAFTENGRIHINLGSTSGSEWGELVELLAHEYGHAIHGLLGERNRWHWFSEGFASWVAARVLHSLHWQDYDLALNRATMELNRETQLVTDLNELDWQWQTLAETPNAYLKTYVLAFVAVARLIDRAGLQAIKQYAKDGNFNRSFPFRFTDFKTEFARDLSSRRPPEERGESVMQMPAWKAGDQWIYAVKHAGDGPSTTKEVAREDTFEGKASYLMRSESRQWFYSKETMDRLAVIKEGKLSSKREDPPHDFSWPLASGKQWQSDYTWVDLVTNNKHRTKRSMVVSAIEKVTVPAGTFLAAKIEAYDFHTGYLMWEGWYSPTTKWFVKSRDYSEVAFREEELTSFKLN